MPATGISAGYSGAAMSPADSARSAASARALSGSEIHDEWSARYRTADNEAAFDAAFDMILQAFGAPPDATILDAGCGTASHTIRLARRGFRIRSVDFSEHALDQAREQRRPRRAWPTGWSSVRRTCCRCRSRTVSSSTRSAGACCSTCPKWPEPSTELARVVGPGGKLAISEPNMRSVQTMALRAVRRVRPGSRRDIRDTAAGIEKWRKTSWGISSPARRTSGG